MQVQQKLEKWIMFEWLQNHFWRSILKLETHFQFPKIPVQCSVKLTYEHNKHWHNWGVFYWGLIVLFLLLTLNLPISYVYFSPLKFFFWLDIITSIFFLPGGTQGVSWHLSWLHISTYVTKCKIFTLFYIYQTKLFVSKQQMLKNVRKIQ